MWTGAVSVGSQPMGARGQGWGGVWKARPWEAGRPHQDTNAIPWVFRSQTSALGKRNTGLLAPQWQRFSSFTTPGLCWGGRRCVVVDVHVQVCAQADLVVLPSALRRERGRAPTPGGVGVGGSSLGREASISRFHKPLDLGLHVGSMVPHGRPWCAGAGAQTPCTLSVERFPAILHWGTRF